ncbi:unnamed protein product, partial [Heterosigma akashiwo]
ALSVPQKKIFCFGDSLTAGTRTSLYAPHLEQKLRNNYAYGCGSAMVRFKGYPGWTTKTLFEGGGLGSTLDKVESAAGKVDLAIILAGTNDLAYDSDADSIFNTLRKIHGVAHSRQIKTIAVGIPPSAWQQQSSVAREVAGKVNAKLQEMNLRMMVGSRHLCPFQSQILIGVVDIGVVMDYIFPQKAIVFLVKAWRQL